MKTERAKCYCGNISADVVLSKPIVNFTPRACDCDFCTKHGAAYISDPEGRLEIRISDPEQATLFTQGSGIAEFLICRACGVLVGVTYSSKGNLIGGLNSRTLENRKNLKFPQAASPKLLSDSEKIGRWEQIWFQNVTIEKGNA